MVHICSYCKNKFTTTSTLLTHQKRAKYCLKLQGAESENFECVCGKKYTVRKSLSRHQDKCTVFSSSLTQETPSDGELALKIMDKYENMFKELQKQIVELSSRPTKVVNNVLNDLRPITDEDLQENLDGLKLDFILDGAKGYANFANFYPLRNNIVCTDKARKKIKYKDENGEITDDSRLLARRFFIAIADRNKDIVDAAYKDTQEEVQTIVAENRAGTSDITGLLTKATKLQTILMKTQNAAEGKDEDFTREFINHLAKIA